MQQGYQHNTDHEDIKDKLCNGSAGAQSTEASTTTHWMEKNQPSGGGDHMLNTAVPGTGQDRSGRETKPCPENPCPRGKQRRWEDTHWTTDDDASNGTQEGIEQERWSGGTSTATGEGEPKAGQRGEEEQQTVGQQNTTNNTDKNHKESNDENPNGNKVTLSQLSS